MPETLRIRAGDLEFSVLTWGAENAPLAMLIHGYPDTAWTWRHLGPYLAERGWRAVAPFTRGYAPTDLAPNDRYLIADQARDVLALRDALGGDAGAVLVGHDWGAAALWRIAAKAPESFARYVAMAVPPPPALLPSLRSPSMLPLFGRQARMSWYFLYNQLPGAERTLDRVIPKHWRDWSPGYDPAEDLGHVFQALAGPGRRRAALRYYRNNLQGGAKATFSGVPRAPVLYLHGDRDGCMNVALAERRRHMLAPGSRFERVSGVGHFLQLEDPARVNALVAEWLGSPSAG